MAETTQVLEFVKGLKQTDEIVEPDYATTSQTITETTNAPGTTDKPAREDHRHAHGNQTTPTHHALVTQSTHGFMSSTDKTKLDKIVHEVLQYENTTDQSTSGTTLATGITLSFPTDRESDAGVLLTKPTNTTFRTNYNGRVEISFQIEVDNTKSYRGVDIYIRRAGTDLGWTQCTGSMNSNNARNQTITGQVELNCSNGNDFEIRMKSRESGTTVTTRPASNGSVGLVRVRAIRLA